MLPISRMKTPAHVVARRERQEGHAAIPVSWNNSGVEPNQRPRNPKVPHEEMVSRDAECRRLVETQAFPRFCEIFQNPGNGNESTSVFFCVSAESFIFFSVNNHASKLVNEERTGDTMNSFSRGIKLSAALCLVTLQVFAQNPATTFRVDVPLVSLDVGVTDPSGRALINLTQEDFQILEEGEPREIKSFSSVETPYNILALFDCTGSTREAWPFLLKALNGFLGTLRPQDLVAVAAFGAGTTTILDWTPRSAESLNVQMKMPSPLCDQTNFYGAVTWATRKLQEVNGRKGVIVFTDGVHGGIPSRPVTVGGLTTMRFVDPG